MWLWGLAAASLSHVRADVHDTGVSVRFQAWCLNASAYLQEQGGLFAAKHDEAAGLLHETQQAVNGLDARFAEIRRAALPQSTEQGAAVHAATAAMEVTFSPEYKALEEEDRTQRQLLAAVKGDYSDAEVFGRRIQAILGQTTKACRLEKDLDAEVQRALNPVVLALLHRKFPIDDTLHGLEQRKEHLLTRQQECVHLAEGHRNIAAAAAAGADATAMAAAAQFVRRESVAVKLGEYDLLGRTAGALKAEAVACFDLERAAYAQESGSVQGTPQQEVVDKAHAFWMQWRDAVVGGYDDLLTFVGQRHQQLDSLQRTQEYLRADDSPHLQQEKIPPPEGFCPPIAEQQKRLQEVNDAIAQIKDIA